ncbi:hypothetical protein V6N13_140159 [Hibiscus sabdariffa]
MLNKEESQLKKGSDASWVDVVSRVLKEEVGFKSHVEDESIAICMGKDYFHGSNRTVMEEFKSMGEHEILGGGFNKASLVGELRLIDYLSSGFAVSTEVSLNNSVFVGDLIRVVFD